MQNIALAELGEQKSKLSYRHAELEGVKVKKNFECSGLLIVLFIFSVLRKGKEKIHSSLFISATTLIRIYCIIILNKILN